MKITREADAVIIGAGISGLATAHFLKKQGLDVYIIEKEPRTGGSIRSEREQGFLIEYGPNSTLDTSPVIHELFADLQIESQMEYANDKSKNRYIMRNGRLNALPMSPLSFLRTPHFSVGAKLRLLKEPFISPADPEADETLADFVRRRLGQEFLDYAIDPFVAGVYAGIPEQLSVRSGFPKLYDLEQKYGSILKGALLGARERKKRQETSKQSAKLFSFPEGMQTATDALTREFQDRLFTGAGLTGLRKNDGLYTLYFENKEVSGQIETGAIILAIPVRQYRNIPGDHFASVLPALEKIEYPPVSMVYFGYRDNPAGIPLDGFGYLIPRNENRQILGTIWSSTIFENRAPQGGIALTTFVGGSRQPENALLPEEQLTGLVDREIRQILQINRKPDLVRIQVWPKAIPQYNTGHQQIIEMAAQFEQQNPGLYLSGNFRGGISVGDCIKQAKSLAEKVAGSESVIRKQKNKQAV